MKAIKSRNSPTSPPMTPAIILGVLDDADELDHDMASAGVNENRLVALEKLTLEETRHRLQRELQVSRSLNWSLQKMGERQL